MPNFNVDLNDVKTLLGEKDVIILSLQNQLRILSIENDNLKKELEGRTNLREFKKPEVENEAV